ncbi:OadG family protein [Streptococcus caviae]|uniref:OadG family protein n=1 Tax=Streptococcus sp. 'caviae' TaxID=1915004 RepID=UPI00094BA8DD|nr:OadG family protein [Streptococcus sp. 'caviae']OLN84822.1 hypothetical protein BMI76_01720 [Streptococcus sp. 'caviae']
MTLTDMFIITLASMGLVFLILTGLMYVIQLTAVLVNASDKRAEPAALSVPAQAARPLTGQELVDKDKHAKIAVITALAIASKEENKQFKIEKVEKVGSQK